VHSPLLRESTGGTAKFDVTEAMRRAAVPL
jgi:hypothetical protein